MNRISLSEKEVAQIHLMLTTLPLPPIPITVQLDTTKMEDEETKTALDMALASVMQDKRTQDGIVNSHSVFAAMSFFLKWSKHGSDPVVQANIVHVKDGILLRLIQQVIDYHCSHPDRATYKDEEILHIFIAISQAWINSYLPVGVTCAIGPATKQANIGYEDNLHISMTHYCYAQGVLYNSKNAQVSCDTHKLLCETLQRQREADETEGDVDETDVGNRHKEKMEPEHVAVAQLYSQFPYHKLMVLCFNRLLQDSLHGHDYVPNEDSKQEIEHNTKELLRLSFDNYKSTLTMPAAASSEQGDQTPVQGDQTPEQGDQTPEQGDQTTYNQIATPISTSKDVSSLFKTPQEGVKAIESEVATRTTIQDLASLFEPLKQGHQEHSAKTLVQGGGIGISSKNTSPACSEYAPDTVVWDPTSVNPTQSKCDRQMEEAVCSGTFGLSLVDSAVPVTGNSQIDVQSVTANYQQTCSELDETGNTTCNTSPRSKTHALNPRDLGGYKSICGIFILEIIAFLDNQDDPRLVQNMTTNLRHLNELLQQDCATTRQALTIINIPGLLHLLRNTPTICLGIQAQLCDIEQSLQRCIIAAPLCSPAGN